MRTSKPVKNAAVPRTARQIGGYIVAGPRVRHGKLTFSRNQDLRFGRSGAGGARLAVGRHCWRAGRKSSPRSHRRGRKAGASFLARAAGTQGPVARSRLLRANEGGRATARRARLHRDAKLECYGVFVHTSILEGLRSRIP